MMSAKSGARRIIDRDSRAFFVGIAWALALSLPFWISGGVSIYLLMKGE